MFNRLFSKPHSQVVSNTCLHVGRVLTNINNGKKYTVVYDSDGIVLIGEDGHIVSPSERQLMTDFRNKGYALRSSIQLEELWQKAEEQYKADKRILTRLGWRLSPAVLRQYLSI